MPPINNSPGAVTSAEAGMLSQGSDRFLISQRCIKHQNDRA